MSPFDPLGWKSLAAVASVIVGAVAGLLARRILLSRLQMPAQRTLMKLDEALVASFRRPLPIWFALAGLYFGSRFIDIPEKWSALADHIMVAAVVLFLTMWAAGLSVRLLLLFAEERNAGAPITGVLLIGARLCVYAIGFLVLLNSLGFSIAPILTTFGIGGVALALGLQDTLSNLFAGMHISIAGNIRVGDFIELESGQRGYVEDIRWRATRIRTLPNNFVLIPNDRLAKSIVTNHNLPTKDLAVQVEVGVHYRSDLKQVERAVCEVATGIMRTVEGGVRDFVPFIRFHTFGQSSIDFTVILRAREFADTFVVKHEFIKALTRRFAEEGIVIPYPIRALNTDQEGEAPRSGEEESFVHKGSRRQQRGGWGKSGERARPAGGQGRHPALSRRDRGKPSR